MDELTGVQLISSSANIVSPIQSYFNIEAFICTSLIFTL